MNPRTLSQILTELAPTYDPQVQSIQGQQAALPGQIQAQEQGLQAKQGEAFDSILSGARSRGVGFSGVPIGEQAKYTASTYLPALAQLHTAGTQQATSLQDAINQINERKNTFAQQLYGADQDRYQQSLEAERQRQAAAASNAGLSALFGGQGASANGTQPQGAVPDLDRAYVDVQKFMSQGRDAAISDYAATLKSAQRGNAYDKLKVAAYQKAGLNQQTLAQFYAQQASGGAPSINWGNAVKAIPGQAGLTTASRPGGLSLGNLGQNFNFFTGNR